jgi:hypothetical protein
MKKMSSPLSTSQAIMTMIVLITAVSAIAVILWASDIAVAVAQEQQEEQEEEQEEQAQSDDEGLTATLNGDSFRMGDTITVSGSVEEREPSSFVGIEVIDPQSKVVERGVSAVTADNTFTYSFVAGVQEEFDTGEPMLVRGNYRMVLTYFPPGESPDDPEQVELVFEYNAISEAPPRGAESSAAGGTITSRSGQPEGIESTTTFFQSANDSFSVQVPDGWIIHDVDNTGSALSQELTKGYGILAQLCPEEEEQGSVVPATTTVPSVGGSPDNTLSCEESESEVIHIIRYPEPDNNRTPAASNTTTTTTAIPIGSNSIITDDSILSYQLNKLQEIGGYRDFEIINNTDTTVNLANPLTNQTATTVPAKLVEMTYSTASAPNEPRVGYLISTGTELTQPNLGVAKGYTVFYEGNPLSDVEVTIGFGSLRPLSPAAGQILDSFELIMAPEVAQALAEQATHAAQTTETPEDVENGDGDGVTRGGDDGGTEDEDGDGDDEGDDSDDEGEEASVEDADNDDTPTEPQSQEPIEQSGDDTAEDTSEGTP